MNWDEKRHKRQFVARATKDCETQIVHTKNYARYDEIEIRIKCRIDKLTRIFMSNEAMETRKHKSLALTMRWLRFVHTLFYRLVVIESLFHYIISPAKNWLWIEFFFLYFFLFLRSVSDNQCRAKHMINMEKKMCVRCNLVLPRSDIKHNRVVRHLHERTASMCECAHCSSMLAQFMCSHRLTSLHFQHTCLCRTVVWFMLVLNFSNVSLSFFFCLLFLWG